MNGILLTYTLSALGYLASSLAGKGVRAANGMLVIGLALNIAVAGHRWAVSGQPPFASLYDVLLVLAAGIVLFSLVAVYRYGVRFAGVVAAASVVPLLAYGSTLDDGIRPLVPALKSGYLAFHVGSYIAGYAACAVAFVAAAGYLWACRADPYAALAARLERLMHGYVMLAFPFLTAGMTLGMLWAEKAWGRYWGWDPKESWSLIAWLIYGYYVHMRIFGNWSGRKTAYLSLAGFAAIMMTLFGVNLLPGGLHSYR